MLQQPQPRQQQCSSSQQQLNCGALTGAQAHLRVVHRGKNSHPHCFTAASDVAWHQREQHRHNKRVSHNTEAAREFTLAGSNVVARCSRTHTERTGSERCARAPQHASCFINNRASPSGGSEVDKARQQRQHTDNSDYRTRQGWQQHTQTVQLKPLSDEGACCVWSPFSCSSSHKIFDACFDNISINQNLQCA